MDKNYMLLREYFVGQIERRTYHDYDFEKRMFYYSKIQSREVKM